MEYRSAIRTRLIDVLKLTVPPEDVRITVPDTSPGSKQDMEGYVITLRGMRGQQRWLSLEQRPTTLLWTIEILGTKSGLGNRYINEVTIAQVADAVANQLNYRNRLQNASGQPLDSVTSVEIVGEEYTPPDTSPEGQRIEQYYTWTFQVQIEFTWNKGATSCQEND